MRATADQIRQALEQIAQEGGGILHAENVVRAAEDLGSVLHDRFEWDDSIAAHAHRLNQARTLIRSVKVEISTSVRKIETVFYVSDPAQNSNEGGYVSIASLGTDRERAEVAIAREFERALSALTRARDIAIACGADAGVDDAVRRVEELAQRTPKLFAVA